MTMGARKRHTPEQVVRKLTRADQLVAEGKDAADVCPQAGRTARPAMIGP
jgi:putative transposase